MSDSDFLFHFWTARGVDGILTFKKKSNSKVFCNIILYTAVKKWLGEPAS